MSGFTAFSLDVLRVFSCEEAAQEEQKEVCVSDPKLNFTFHPNFLKIDYGSWFKYLFVMFTGTQCVQN